MTPYQNVQGEGGVFTLMGAFIFAIVFIPLMFLGYVLLNLWLYGVDGIKKEFIGAANTDKLPN